jgi:hypothetical protein
MRNHTPAHEIDEYRCEPGLYDVPAKHNDYCSLSPRGGYNGVDDAAEVPRHEDIWQRRQKRTERAVVARRLRKLGGADLVRSARNGDCANGAKICLCRSALRGCRA